jgi:hypothetical protein
MDTVAGTSADAASYGDLAKTQCILGDPAMREQKRL